MSQQIIKLLREALADASTPESEKDGLRKALKVYGVDANRRADIPDSAKATALSPYAAELDRKMGLQAQAAPGFTGTDPSMFVQPMLTPTQARAQLARRAGAR